MYIVFGIAWNRKQLLLKGHISVKSARVKVNKVHKDFFYRKKVATTATLE